ncbi:MAG: helix-turn-helix domain-containing protein [Clostridiales Family XIII bacterium]|nr:helix-turn-helix domain-containing protein [Clostridiales Family XIII bacterium]
MIELDNNAIGVVIRDLRKKKGLSQEVLSGFAVIARSHLAMIETGDKIPNLITLWRIATALDLHPYELIKMIEQASAEK